MTQDDSSLTELAGESTRRTFVKAGALASGGLALGLSGTGSALAQDGGGGQGQQMPGLMFQNQFFPRARFTVASQQLDWAPVAAQNAAEGGLFQNPQLFANMNTRVVKYQFGGNQFALLMVPNQVSLQEGQTYQLSPAFGAFGTEDFQDYGIGGDVTDPAIGEGFNQLGMVTVQFSPVSGGGGGQTTTQSDGGGDQTTDGGGDGGTQTTTQSG